MGRLYLVEHCVYRYNESQKRMVYEVYVTDRLKAINDSVASFFGGQTVKKRYAELLEESRNVKKEERTAEEIIASISEKLERIGNEPI